MFEYRGYLDREFCNLMELKFRLDFLEMVGKDVTDYQKYVDSKIKEIQCLQLECHKIDLIHKRQLPTSCFRKCDYNCFECENNLY